VSVADPADTTIWGDDDRQLATVARNVGTRYMAIILDALIGLVLLPFNVHHLGQSAYGLWMLTSSMTTYFSILDLGFGGSIVKFVAQYRARRDAAGLNDIASTLFVIFSVIGVVAYGVFLLLAFNIQRVFNLSPEQLATGRALMLIIGVYVSLGFPFSIFGGIINGFQRYDLNNVVGTTSSVLTAVANVAVLAAGYGLVELVAATTVVRLLTYLVYRANAYRVFGGLQIRIRSFRRERLRELTSFSVYMLAIDWANKMNYSIDALVIGAFLSTGAVAVWTVGQRLAEVTQRLTNQLNDVLFPTVVDHDSAARTDRLQAIFIQGTRLSLATVVPMGGAMILMAGPLVQAWVGSEFHGSVLVLQLLSLSVIIRVGSATAGTVLKGAGEHRLVALTNVMAALVNVGLSIVFVKAFGLPGVALGTLLPIFVASTGVLFPAGCRRVELPMRRALVEGVWPAVWPAAVMSAFLLATRPLVATTLVAVGADMAAACLLYALVFVFFGISAVERQFYLSKSRELMQRRAPVHPVAEGA
jgi:O-antigen/teichoic acid export membrane protein